MQMPRKKILLNSIIISIFCLAFAEADIVTNNLVFELNAANPGGNPDVYWKPLVGSTTFIAGQLLPYGTIYTSIPFYYMSTYNGLPAPCYKFSPITTDMSRGGRVGNLGIEAAENSNQIFLPNKDFSIEIWIKPERKYAGSLIKENIFSTMDGSAAIGLGFSLSTRYDSSDGKLRLESHLATATGSTGTDRYYMLGPSGYFTANQWHQVVFTFKKDTGSGDSSTSAVAKWYVDAGAAFNVTNESRNDGDPLNPNEFITSANHASIGSRCDGGMISPGVFKGEIAVVRIYSKELSTSEIAQNYAQGISSADAPQEIFSLDASTAGNRTDTNWEPSVAVKGNPHGGDLVSINSKERIPARHYETYNNQALWYYEFDPNAVSGGQVGGFEIPTDTFDVEKKFTVEMWIKAGGSPASGQKEFLFGTRNLSTGFYLGTRFNNPSGSTYMFESAVNADNGTKFGGPSLDNTATVNQWTHVVYVFNGSSTSIPTYSWYINGIQNRSGTCNCYGDCNLPFTGDFAPRGDTTALGAESYFNKSTFAASSRGYFRGKIAKLCVYNYALNQTEISQRYAQFIPLTPLPSVVNEPNYVTNGLIFYLNANNPGDHLWQQWLTKSDSMTSSGELLRVGTNGSIPTFKCEPNSPWFFSFEPKQSSGSQVAELGIDPNIFDVDKDFTVELLLRANGNPASGLQEFLFGTMTDDKANGTGLSLCTKWDDSNGPTTDTYRLEAKISDSAENAILIRNSADNAAEKNKWVHVAYVFHGSNSGTPSSQWYVNGLASGSDFMNCSGGCAEPLTANYDYVPNLQTAALGARESDSNTSFEPAVRSYYNGDMALCRVYNRALTSAEINQNYLSDRLTGDLNTDNKVDAEDILLMAQSWLSKEGQTGWNPNANLYYADNLIDMKDFSILARNWKIDNSPKPRPHAPFKVLYDNDFTNSNGCVSPFHYDGAPFTPEVLKGTIDETAGTGTQVHLIQPSSCWTPWWISNVYPMQEHLDWYKNYTGKNITANEFKYPLAGYDPVKLFFDHTWYKGESPFFSFRLNDGHHAEYALDPATCVNHTSKFEVENSDFRIGPGLYDIYVRLQWIQNWAIPEVREYKISLLKEICEKFDMGGLEIDFMRHWAYFNMATSTSAERKAIMLDFIKQIRSILDSTSRNGRYRYLCVRIPCYIAYFDNLGIDLSAWTSAGVDMVNVSPSYFTIQQTDAAAIKQMVPNTPVYLEMCHTTRLGEDMGDGYGDTLYRRTTPLQYYTTAHLAYSRGLDGLSLFNFVYYRDHNTGLTGPYNEPPFEIITHLNDPNWLAQQPQHYMWRTAYNEQVNATQWAPNLQNGQSPDLFSKNGTTKNYNFDMVPPTGGWTQNGRLRIQSDISLGSTIWSAKVNNQELASTPDVNEPYLPAPYPQILGEPNQHRAWIVPKEILTNGINQVQITRTRDGDPNSRNVVFIDIAIQ
jgi:hypothetical protein